MEVPPAQVFHREVRLLSYVWEIEDADDVRMIEAGHETRLAHEELVADVVFGEPREQPFQDDLAGEAACALDLREQDLAHPAAMDRAEDRVLRAAAEGRIGRHHRRRGRSGLNGSGLERLLRTRSGIRSRIRSAARSGG